MQNYTEEQISNTFGGFYIIDINDKNLAETYEKWSFNGIYKRSQTDGILYWQIGYNNETKKLISLHGFHISSKGEHGSLIRDELDIVENMSGRSYKSQAYLEAHKKYIDKIRQGYSPDVNSEQNLINDLPEAQLAKDYPLDLKGGKSPISEHNFSIGISCQVKLDGIRVRAIRESDEIKLYSRNNKEFKWLKKVRQELETVLNMLPPKIGLDCEIYSTDMVFEQLVSVVKTEKHEHVRNNELKCYVFDIIILNLRLEDRIKMLQDAYLSIRSSGYQFTHVFILTHKIVNTHAEIVNLHSVYVEAGYEGVMLRKLSGTNPSQKDLENSYYKPRRNANLFKVKNFYQAEGTIIGYKSGEGREKGLIIFILQDDVTGKVFDCRPRGSFDIRRQQYLIGEELIGKKYTYRYFELTDLGIPRHPTGLVVRDYE